MLKHLILGAGPAGVIAAETIRKHAGDDRIFLVGDESEPPYSRMAIPYLLIGKVGEPGTFLRHDPGHYERLRIELKRGVRATRVDTRARVVSFDDGSTLEYDRLLIATGSSPIQPPIPGIDGPGVHTCWTLNDARAIADRARPGARVIQIGAGFIGCIIMEALAMRGVRLSVVETGDRMVPRMMGPTAGGMIRQWVQSKGVAVYTGSKVEAIEHAADVAPARIAEAPGLMKRIAGAFGIGGDAAATTAGDAPMCVRLSGGERLEADLVISATGVRPNIGFLEGTGVKCLLGVLTDEHMRTSAEGVYAAGDCAEAFDRVSGRSIVSAIQPNAAEQARVAALNMVGQRAVLGGVTQINVLDTLGLISTSFGEWQGVPGGEHVELTDQARGRHLSLQFEGDRMVGCNSVGWTEHVGVMRGLVEGRVRLGAWKDRLLQDPTLLMQAYLASAQAQAAQPLVKARR